MEDLFLPPVSEAEIAWRLSLDTLTERFREKGAAEDWLLRFRNRQLRRHGLPEELPVMRGQSVISFSIN